MSARTSSLTFFTLLFAIAMNLNAQTIEFTSFPAGYFPDSVTLPRPFAGALAADPTDPEIVYAAIGAFNDMEIARVNLATKGVTTIASGPFSSIGGIAVLSPTQIVLVENAGTVANPYPFDTILLVPFGRMSHPFYLEYDVPEALESVQQRYTIDPDQAPALRREYAGNPSGEMKSHQLQGPIQDAFRSAFIAVRGTGQPWHEGPQIYAAQRLDAGAERVVAHR